MRPQAGTQIGAARRGWSQQDSGSKGKTLGREFWFSAKFLPKMPSSRTRIQCMPPRRQSQIGIADDRVAFFKFGNSQLVVAGVIPNFTLDPVLP
jgi:hypothetical protein